MRPYVVAGDARQCEVRHEPTHRILSMAIERSSGLKPTVDE